ncbi:hypothetical protein IT575_15695 [bacterium]|nr:hypothetical protein [bacterium]
MPTSSRAAGSAARKSAARSVRLSLYSPAKLAGRDRLERKARLLSLIETWREGLEGLGARIDLRTISVSAQSVSAVVPAARAQAVIEFCSEHGITATPVETKKVIA